MKKYSLHIIIVLCLLNVISFMKISNLQSSLQNMESNLSSSISNVSSEVGNIYSNVDERLKRQSSIIDYMDYEFGKINQNDLTIPITFSLTPKEITKSSVVTLDVAGKNVTMKRNGGTFTAIIPVSIFDGFTPKVIIEDGDILKNEQLNDFSIGNIKDRVLPELYAFLDGQSSYGSGEYKRTGNLNIECKQVDSSVAFTEARLVIEIDNKVISDKKISPNREWDRFDYEIDEKIALENEQTCTITVIAIDTLELEHHCVVDRWVKSDSNDRSEPHYFGDEIIYKSNGELVYKPEYIEL
ncbi:MAG: hypothetical protein VB095_00680 [Anaerovorax sp.]|nr:hypothetical protein [Anaerovorax sp.]